MTSDATARNQPCYIFKLPFGEVISAGIGGRSQSQGYVSDSVRQGFTAYERDDETGLDYAQARYYSSALGRFVTSDPIYIATKRLRDPQQLNIYIYVRNNPLNFADPTGLDFEISGADAEQYVKGFNNRSKPAFQVKRNNKGVLEVIDKDKVNVKKLNKSEAALFSAIVDPQHHAAIVTGPKSDSNDFEGFVGTNRPDVIKAYPQLAGKGINVVDSSDMALLRGASKVAAGETIAHAMLEAYNSANTGSNDYHTNHDAASEFFPEPKASDNSLDKVKGDTIVSSYSEKLTFSRANISVTVTYEITTPVPKSSVTTNTPANITKIKLINK